MIKKYERQFENGYNTFTDKLNAMAQEISSHLVSNNGYIHMVLFI